MEATEKENEKEIIEQRFRLITDVISHMVWEMEPDGTVSYINKQWQDWTGLTLEQINKGGWTRVFHPGDHKNIFENWQQALNTKSEYFGEYRIQNSNGKYYWFMGKTVPIKDKTGQVVKWIGTSTNIDRQKKTEEALKESESRFRQLADVMPQQVWTANEKGELDYVNLVTINYFGKNEEEIIGAGWQSVIHPNDLDAVLRTWQRSLLNHESYQVEFRLKAKDETYRWHLARASCFESKNEKIKWFGTNTDIEAHKANEQKKDEFISMASHELKTPVTTIKGYAHILQSRFESEGNEDAALLVKRMDLQINKLTKLIEDFLNVSKIESEQLQLDKQVFNFNELVEECVSGVQLTSPTHKIIIEETEAIQYKGDRLRLEQVINNFLNNAVKYSPDAEDVFVKYNVQLDNIVMSVQDFGIGIANENLLKIFDRFYRADNSAMMFQGLGLGLYISSEIIKAHNGSFWIESEVGKGSTFYFLLPLNEKQDISIDTDNKTYYSDRHVKIKYEEAEKYLEADWTGFQNLQSVQKGCMIMLDLLKKNKCSKVLNDNTHVLGNWSEAADWGGKIWFPQMQQAGLKYFAWIYSQSTFSKLSAHKSLDVMAGNITTQFFSEVMEAKEWLKEMN